MHHGDQPEEPVRAAMGRYYELFCFKGGATPDPEELRDLFMPEGKVINSNPDLPRALNVEQFIDLQQAQATHRAATGFYEREQFQKIDLFGNVAHVLSTYAKLDRSHTEPFALGVGSVQLIKVQERWLISVVAWYDQTAEVQVPERYL